MARADSPDIPPELLEGFYDLIILCAEEDEVAVMWLKELLEKAPDMKLLKKHPPKICVLSENIQYISSEMGQLEEGITRSTATGIYCSENFRPYRIGADRVYENKWHSILKDIAFAAFQTKNKAIIPMFATLKDIDTCAAMVSQKPIKLVGLLSVPDESVEPFSNDHLIKLIEVLRVAAPTDKRKRTLEYIRNQLEIRVKYRLDREAKECCKRELYVLKEQNEEVQAARCWEREKYEANVKFEKNLSRLELERQKYFKAPDSGIRQIVHGPIASPQQPIVAEHRSAVHVASASSDMLSSAVPLSGVQHLTLPHRDRTLSDELVAHDENLLSRQRSFPEYTRSLMSKLGLSSLVLETEPYFTSAVASSSVQHLVCSSIGCALPVAFVAHDGNPLSRQRSSPGDCGSLMSDLSLSSVVPETEQTIKRDSKHHPHPHLFRPITTTEQHETQVGSTQQQQKDGSTLVAPNTATEENEKDNTKLDIGFTTLL